MATNIDKALTPLDMDMDFLGEDPSVGIEIEIDEPLVAIVV